MIELEQGQKKDDEQSFIPLYTQQCQHQNFSTDHSLRLHHKAGEVHGAHLSRRWGWEKYDTHTVGITSMKTQPLKYHCWAVDMALYLVERWSILVECVNLY